MTIETKFNINDLVQYKYQRATARTLVAYEVIEIKTICCYTTSQVFYICRVIVGMWEEKWKVDNRAIEDFSPGESKSSEYTQMREDELKPCSPELAEEIKKGLEV